MKVLAVTALTALLLVAPAAASSVTPTTRVVELLKGLAEQAEKEGKVEEGLYEDFVCWGKSIIMQKTDSNEKANSRIDYLETYISDIDSGRIDFTGQRASLEKEIGELMADLESAKALREKENEEFKDASAEMNQAITALKEAIKVLGDATKDHKDGVLLAVRSRLREGGMAGFAARQAALKQAAQLGEKFLSKADSIFLQRVLLGEVPDVDWKKLNRKATFKMSYKARSFKIQDILAKMLQTFESNLKDITTKEGDAKDTYLKLKGTKSDQLDEARKALTSSSEEAGERGMNREEAADELKALQTQVKNDLKFIGETEKSLADKKKEWQVRSELRAGEIAAINKAVSILHSDDARDTFKESFSSQVSLLQTLQKKKSHAFIVAHAAAVALRSAAHQTGKTDVLSLASKLEAPDKLSSTHFKEVIDAIDKMVLKLKKDEDKDLEIKQTCEQDRMYDTRDAILDSRDIDEMTDLITKLTAHMEQLDAEMKDLTEEIKETKKALSDATRMRKDENLDWKKNDKSDTEAAKLVGDARAVLQKFYDDNNLMLVQKSKQPVTDMAAGDAPPPPPTTWEAPYGGKTGEATGILSIMDMVKEDILKDQATAKSEEDAAQKEFDEFEKDSNLKIKNLKKQFNDAKGAYGDASRTRSNTKRHRSSTKDKLVSTIKTIKEIDPNCEYFEVNYVMRRENRHTEMDGLLKAKAILKGGKFDAPDPDREITPGDAAAAANLLQSRRA